MRKILYLMSFCYKKNNYLLKVGTAIMFIFMLIALPSINVYGSNNSSSGKAALQQKIKISGKIVSSKDGLPLPGVTVKEKGTNNGIITDIDGKYTISVQSADAVLIFSFLGFVPEEKVVGSQSTLDISLNEDIQKLDEVVVVGYGSVKKSDISGAVVSVTGEDMMKKTPTNILQGLKGSAAGVLVTAQDGAPDANSAIRIRGVGTITGNANPLYVIDGVVVGNSANFLNPSDVETVEVLKDASATAIYGAAGANGVIMITTKHGIVGATKVTFTADLGVETLAGSSKLAVGNADQYALNIRTARANDGGALANPVFGAQYDGQRNSIDWQKLMTRQSIKKQYNVTATGGTDKTQSTLSISYLNNDGVVINTNMNRLTAHANVVTKAADFIEIGGDINFVHQESHGSNGGFGNNGNLSSIRDMAFSGPTMDYVDPTTHLLVKPNVINANGTYGTIMQSTSGQYDGLTSDNLYAVQMENNGLSKNNTILASSYLTLKLFKGLSIKSVASYNFGTGSYQNFWGNKKRYMPDGITPVVLAGYDTRTQLNINGSQWYTLQDESYLTYEFKNDIHSLSVMAGNSVSESFGSWANASGIGYPADNVRDISLSIQTTDRFGAGAYNSETNTLSYFGRLLYTLKDRYIVTGTLRRDGSSNFGAGNQYGVFPSAALAWRVSEEDFLKNVSAISNLKLRLGWGQSGNQGTKQDQQVAQLKSNASNYYTYGQNGVAGLGSTASGSAGYYIPIVDTNLKWETNTQSNIGIDLGLLKNTVSFTLDVFDRSSSDLLLDRGTRASTGYTSVYTNYGGVDNKGFEFSIDYKKQINNDLFVSAQFTGSYFKNKITKMGADLANVDDGGNLTAQNANDGSNVGPIGSASGTHWDAHSMCRTGYAVGSYYGYQVAGVFNSQAEVDTLNSQSVWKHGHAAGSTFQNAKTGQGDFKYKDLNGDGIIDNNDMAILGNGFPSLNYGLNINVTFKNIDVSINSYGVTGQKIYSYSSMALSNMFPSDNGTTPNILTSVASEAWTPANHSQTMSKLSILDYNYNMRGSDKWIQNGDFFKISNFQVGYTFDKQLLKPLRMQSARVYLSIQNLLCISSYNKYGDPEVGQGSVLFTGLDAGRYPNPRIYSFGMNIQF